MKAGTITRYVFTPLGIYSPGVEVHPLHAYAGGWTCLMPSLAGHPIIADIPTDSIAIGLTQRRAAA